MTAAAGAVPAIIALVHERDELVARIARIDASIAAFAAVPGYSTAASERPPKNEPAPAKRAAPVARERKKSGANSARINITDSGKFRCIATIDSVVVHGPTRPTREEAQADIIVAMDASRSADERRAALRSSVRVYAFKMTPEQRSAAAVGAAARRWTRRREPRASSSVTAPADPPADPLPAADPASIRKERIAKAFPYVEKVARRLARRLPGHVQLDDLISSGVAGLMEAADRYDPRRLDRFEAFAEFRIRGAMLDALRVNDTLSRDMRHLSNELRDATRRLEAQLGRTAEPDEIARELGIDVDAFYARQKKLSGSSVVSIEDAGPDLLERVSDRAATDPFEAAARRQLVERLSEAIEDLPDRQRKVLSLLYVDGMTMAAAGDILGVTESRVCQIHGEAAKALREALGDEFNDSAA